MKQVFIVKVDVAEYLFVRLLQEALSGEHSRYGGALGALPRSTTDTGYELYFSFGEPRFHGQTAWYDNSQTMQTVKFFNDWVLSPVITPELLRVFFWSKEIQWTQTMQISIGLYFVFSGRALEARYSTMRRSCKTCVIYRYRLVCLGLVDAA